MKYKQLLSNIILSFKSNISILFKYYLFPEQFYYISQMIKPIYLFSDSQLLFWKEDGHLFISRLLEDLGPLKNVEHVNAAYIGASNGDISDFFEIFLAAMAQLNVSSCRLIPSKPTKADLEFLNAADLILLAGGEVRLGWEVMKENGVAEIIRSKRQEGVTLLGISAGAIQLGLFGMDQETTFDTFQFAPFIIDAHDEANDWERLSTIVTTHQGISGYGIPFGGGLVYHPDGTIEAVRNSLVELISAEDSFKKSVIRPH